MRVIGGTHRGRHIESSDRHGVRPTADRTREAVFNALYSMGLPHDVDVVDAFAGTGALGIEALSRGARSAVFIERHPKLCELVERNLATLELEGRVLRADAAIAIASVDRDTGLVLADPPYEFDGWPAFLAACPSCPIVIESDREIVPEPDHGFEAHRVRKYGRAVVTILVPIGANAPLDSDALE